MQYTFPWHEQAWQYLVNRKNLDSLPHAILIGGMSGIGKFIFAKNFASLLLCQDKPAATPCGTCDACRLLQANNHPDLLVVQPEEEGKIIKIDQIREVITDLNNTSHQGGYKILIIEPAELLNIAAANALLKTLEEPAPHVVIILVTSHPKMLSATIRSRCQLLSMAAPKYLAAEAWLKKQIPDADAALLLALAENAPLKALNLAKDDILLRRQEFFIGLDDFWQDKISLISMVAQCLDWDLAEFLVVLMYLVDDMIKIKFNVVQGIVNRDQVVRLTNFATKASMEKLFSYKDHLCQLRRYLFNKINLNQQLIVENLIITWANL